ncbi:MAG: hypothetical protein QOK12_3118 [Mycobacterium sp.]|nr:hypothetical protein [Mycobacterium sp.]
MAWVLVLLSQVMVTLRSRNLGMAGMILRLNVELAASAKPRLMSSIAYVHCETTPLRSVMSASSPPRIGLKETVGPSFGGGGGGGNGSPLASLSSRRPQRRSRHSRHWQERPRRAIR